MEQREWEGDKVTQVSSLYNFPNSIFAKILYKYDETKQLRIRIFFSIATTISHEMIFFTWKVVQ